MERNMATLEEFLKEGKLGPLQVGLSAEEVMANLGPPDDASGGKSPVLLRYGGMQLSLTRGADRPEYRINRMALHFRPKFEGLPELLRPTDWYPSESTTEADFRSFVEKRAITVHSAVDGESGRHLVLDTGATAIFAQGYLECIQSPRRRSSVVVVNIPDAALPALRQESRNSNRSLPAICEEWIADRARSATGS
jgi:hypothetical protein